MKRQQEYDIAILGGGLSGCLIALALWKNRPDLKVGLFEGGESLGGNHLWSFFENDIPAEDKWLIAPLVSHSWRDYDVRFPNHSRTLRAAYHSIRSTQLDAHVRATLPEGVIHMGKRILAATADSLTLEQEGRILVGGVIDARGPGRLSELDLGWQKFLGQELRLSAPHGLERPIIMDAAVNQDEGYRFVYCLPFDSHTVFIEDTYYSEEPEINSEALRQRIADYVYAQGWAPVEILREEESALPVAMGGNFDTYWRSGGDGRAKAGLRAGLFHPTTGYSLPDAVRTAIMISRLDDISGSAMDTTLHDYAAGVWKKRGFYRALDRMLFRAARPAERYKILERFYTLDRKLISRFYAAETTLWDKIRILLGKPPVPISRAISALMSKKR